MSLYLGATAITKLVVDERESAALERLVAGKALATSRVAVVEVTKAVGRVDPGADAGGVLSRMAFIEIDADLARLAGATGGPSLRALDAVHVASALRLAPADRGVRDLRRPLGRGSPGGRASVSMQPKAGGIGACPRPRLTDNPRDPAADGH